MAKMFKHFLTDIEVHGADGANENILKCSAMRVYVFPIYQENWKYDYSRTLYSVTIMLRMDQSIMLINLNVNWVNNANPHSGGAEKFMQVNA